MKDENELYLAKQLAHYEHTLRRAEISHERHERWGNESFQATIMFARISITALVALNGLAAVNVLHFAASAAREIDAPLSTKWINELSDALILFSIGLSLAVVTAGVSYLSQTVFTHHHGDEGRRKLLCAGITLQVAACACALISLICFIIGCFASLDAFGRIA